jgi:phosphate transport system protein
MERHFHHDLEALRDRLSEMAGRCETALNKAMEAVIERSVRLAEEIRLEDLAIDKIELEVEERCIAFLGLQQPVARDLRFLVAAIRMSNDLERIGDHAVNIAQGAIKLSRLPEFRPMEDLPRMADGTIEMLHDAVTAWLSWDSTLARQVCERDVEIDAFKSRVFSRLSAQMVRDPGMVPRALELLLVSRNLERVADLATNIAEEAIFVAEARVIKHHAEQESTRTGGPIGSGPSAR